MLAKLIELLKPNVSTEAKLTGVTAAVGKELWECNNKFKFKIKVLERTGLFHKDN